MGEKRSRCFLLRGLDKGTIIPDAADVLRFIHAVFTLSLSKSKKPGRIRFLSGCFLICQLALHCALAASLSLLQQAGQRDDVADGIVADAIDGVHFVVAAKMRRNIRRIIRKGGRCRQLLFPVSPPHT